MIAKDQAEGMLLTQLISKWVVIVPVVILLGGIITVLIGQEKKQNPVPEKHYSEILVLVGLSILFLFVPRFHALEMLVNSNEPVLVPLTIFVLLPILFAGKYISRSISFLITGISGIGQWIFVSKNVFTLIFWVAIYIVWIYLLKIHPEKKNNHSKLNFHILLPLLVLWLYSGTVLFLCLLMSGEGGVADLLGTVYSGFWKQYFLFSVLFWINGGIFFLISLYGKFPQRNQNSLTATGTGEPESRNHLFTIISGISLLVIVLTGIIWKDMENRSLKLIKKNSVNTAALVLNDYQFYLESGGSFIHQFATYLSDYSSDTLSLETELKRINELTPYFSDLLVLQNGEIISSFPDGNHEKIPDSILYSVDQVMGTQFPYRREVVIAPDAVMYYYLSPISETQLVIVGVCTTQNHPFLSSSFTAMQELPGQMLLVDDLGGGIYPDHSFNDRMAINQFIASHHDNEENLYSDGSWQFTYLRDIGNLRLLVVHTIKQSEINEIIYTDSRKALFSILLLGMASAAGMLLREYYLQKRVVKVLAWLKQLDEFHYISPPKLDDDLVLTALMREVNRIFISVFDRVKGFEDQCQLLQVLGEQTTIQELIRYVVAAPIFSQVDSVRFLFTPEIMAMFAPSDKNAFSRGKLSERYEHLDRVLMDGMKKKEFHLVKDTSRIKFPQADGNLVPGTFAVKTLKHGNHLWGIAWIGKVQPHSLDEGIVQTFELMMEETSRAIASLYFMNQVQTEKLRIESIIQSIPEPVLVLDHVYNLMMENSSAQALSISAGDTGNLDSFKQKKLIPFIKQMTQGGNLNREISFSNGRVYSVQVSTIKTTNLTSGDWIVCTFHDVSDYEKKDEMRSEFLEIVGQYIQMPLKMAAGYIGMLDTIGDINQAQREYINAVSHHLQEMDRFVNGVLDINRISAGIGIQREPCYGTDLINETISRIMPTARQRKITIHSDTLPPKAVTKFEADPALFSQALYNVLENAVKFNRLGGEIHIGIEADEYGVLFSIQDTGIGIAPLDIPHIFDGLSGSNVGVSENTSKMGLALTKSIIDRHGGTINVISKLGSGSTFIIRMPKSQEN